MEDRKERIDIVGSVYSLNKVEAVLSLEYLQCLIGATYVQQALMHYRTYHFALLNIQRHHISEVIYSEHIHIIVQAIQKHIVFMH